MAGTLIGVASYVWRYGIAVMDAARSPVRILTSVGSMPWFS